MSEDDITTPREALLIAYARLSEQLVDANYNVEMLTADCERLRKELDEERGVMR